MGNTTSLSSRDDAPQLRQEALSLFKAGKLPEAILLLERVVALRPQSPEAHNDLAAAYWRARGKDKALEHYAAAAALAPGNPYATANHGACLLETGRLKEAHETLNRAFALKPDHFETLNSLGLLFYRAGDLAQAERFFRQVVTLKPDWHDGYLHLGNVFRDTRRMGEAEKCYRRALKIAPRSAAAWSDLGHLFALQMKDDDALRCQQQAIALTPAFETAWMRMAEVQEKGSRLEDLAATLEKAEAHFPQATWRMAGKAKLMRRQGKAAEAIALMERHLQDVPALEAGFFFELGQLYDRAENTNKAFSCFTQAHAAEAAALGDAMPDKNAFPSAIRRIRAQFTPQMAEGPRPAEYKTQDPVFIVGFPRSGTTLLDQILSSHPAIDVAEERPGIHRMTEELLRITGSTAQGFWNEPRYPACIAQLTAEDIPRLRAAYFAGHERPYITQGRIFVDKLPLNMLHAGLIKRVFPRAKFLLALRHPCDAVLSCFMQQFTLNLTMVQFTDIRSAARFYDDVFSLWEHYVSILPLDMHKVHYEDVVDDFRGAIEPALSFLGLPWDDAVLEYDRTAKEKGRINTPSYHQVTEKIYRRSSGRWRRYRAHLQPVLDILEPHARRHGYEMDE